MSGEDVKEEVGSSMHEEAPATKAIERTAAPVDPTPDVAKASAEEHLREKEGNSFQEERNKLQEENKRLSHELEDMQLMYAAEQHALAKFREKRSGGVAERDQQVKELRRECGHLEALVEMLQREIDKLHAATIEPSQDCFGCGHSCNLKDAYCSFCGRRNLKAAPIPPDGTKDKKRIDAAFVIQQMYRRAHKRVTFPEVMPGCALCKELQLENDTLRAALGQRLGDGVRRFSDVQVRSSLSSVSPVSAEDTPTRDLHTLHATLLGLQTDLHYKLQRM